MIEYPSKGITLLFAFFSITGTLGVDKFYTGNYILGLIQSILSLSYVGFFVSIVLNMITIFILLLTIFTGINFLFYVKWEQPTNSFDYIIAILVSLYIVTKQYILCNQEKFEKKID